MSNSKRRRCLAPEYSCFPATETKTSSTYTAHFINAKLSAQKSLLKDEPKPITAKPQQNSAAWVAAQPEGPTVPFAPVRCLWPSPPVLDFLASQIDAIEDHNLAPILELFDVQYSSNSNGSAIGQALRARSGTSISGTVKMHPGSAIGQSQTCQPSDSSVALPGQASAPFMLPLAEPELLCGHKGEHVVAHAGLLPMWEKLELQPASSPKPLQYTVLVPEELAPAARVFFRDVSAAYGAIGGGPHLPAPTCTLLRRVSGIAPIPRTPAAGAQPPQSAGSSSAGPSLPQPQPVVHPVTGPVTNHMQGFNPGAQEPLVRIVAVPSSPCSIHSAPSGGTVGAQVGGVAGVQGAGAGAKFVSASKSLEDYGPMGPVQGSGPAGSGPSSDSWWLNLRHTLDSLQRSLMTNRPRLSSPAGADLGAGAEVDAGYVVYVVPPSSSAADALRCLLEAASRLTPCTAAGASAVATAAAATTSQLSPPAGEEAHLPCAGTASAFGLGSGSGAVSGAAVAATHSSGYVAAGSSASYTPLPSFATAPLGISLNAAPQAAPPSSQLDHQLELPAKRQAMVDMYGGAARDLYQPALPSSGSLEEDGGEGGGQGQEGSQRPFHAPSQGVRTATPFGAATPGIGGAGAYGGSWGAAGVAAASAASAAAGTWGGSLEVFERSQPLDITLQLVLPSSLAELSGRAVKGTALAVFNKVRRLPNAVTCTTPASQVLSAEQRLRASATIPLSPSALPPSIAATSSGRSLLYEPLLVLAPPPLPSPPLSSSASGAISEKTGTPQQAAAAAPLEAMPVQGQVGSPVVLHCAYEWAPCTDVAALGGTWVAVVWTDSMGQLLERMTLLLKPDSGGMVTAQVAAAAAAGVGGFRRTHQTEPLITGPPPASPAAVEGGQGGACTGGETLSNGRGVGASNSSAGSCSHDVERAVCESVLSLSLRVMRRMLRSIHRHASGASTPTGTGAADAVGTNSMGEVPPRSPQPAAPVLVVTRTAWRLGAAEAAAWAHTISGPALAAAWEAGEAGGEPAAGVTPWGVSEVGAHMDQAVGTLSPWSCAAAGPPASTPGAGARTPVPRVLVASVGASPTTLGLGLDPVHAALPGGALLLCAPPPTHSLQRGPCAASSAVDHGSAPLTAMRSVTATVVSLPGPASATALAAGAPCVQQWTVTVEMDSQPEGLAPPGHHGCADGGGLAGAGGEANGSGQEVQGALASNPLQAVAPAQPSVFVAHHLHRLTTLAAAYRVAHSIQAVNPHGLAKPGSATRSGPQRDCRPLLPLHCQAARQLLALCAATHKLVLGAN